MDVHEIVNNGVMRPISWTYVYDFGNGFNSLVSATNATEYYI